MLYTSANSRVETIISTVCGDEYNAMHIMQKTDSLGCRGVPFPPCLFKNIGS